MCKFNFFILSETNIRLPYEITKINLEKINIKYFYNVEELGQFSEENFIQPDFLLIINSPNILETTKKIKNYFDIFIINTIIIYKTISEQEKYQLLKNGFIFLFEYSHHNEIEFNYILKILIKRWHIYQNYLKESNELNKNKVKQIQEQANELERALLEMKTAKEIIQEQANELEHALLEMETAKEIMEDQANELERALLEMETAKEIMEDQANELANALLEMETAKQTIEKQKAKIEADLKKASIFQLSLLPSNIDNDEFFKINYYYKPSTQLSGDFFDFYKKDNNSYIIIIADVMGHGTQAALVSTTIKIAFREIVKNYYKPGEILTLLNTKLYDILDKAQIYFTALCCYVAISFDKLIIANAGHYFPIPINIKINEDILQQNTNVFIGVLKSTLYNNMNLKLSDFKNLLFFTDGIIEAQNEKKEQYGKNRLTDIFLKYKNLEPEIINQKIIEDLNSFSNKDIFDDDITLITLKTNISGS